MPYRRNPGYLLVICGAVSMMIAITHTPRSFADDGASGNSEAVRDRDEEGGKRERGGPRDGEGERGGSRDGERDRGGPRDGERFQSMRDRMQQARPDGQFSGRPGPGDGQRGPAMIPIFRALDRNNDGRVDASELDLAIASLRTLDKNGDGELSPQELLAPGLGQMGMMGRPDMGPRPGMDFGGRRPEGDRPGMGPGQMPSVEEMFKQMDRDGDGSISKEEAPGRIAENFDRVDQNGDGKIDKAEMEVARQRMATMGPRDRDGRGESNEPAGGTRPRRPETEE